MIPLHFTRVAHPTKLPSRRTASKLKSPWNSSLAAFVACGIVPIVAYVGTNLLACAMFSLAELMLLGVARARTTGEAVLYGLVQTSGLGAAAGAVAYGVGRAVHALA